MIIINLHKYTVLLARVKMIIFVISNRYHFWFSPKHCIDYY